MVSYNTKLDLTFYYSKTWLDMNFLQQYLNLLLLIDWLIGISLKWILYVRNTGSSLFWLSSEELGYF